MEVMNSRDGENLADNSHKTIWRENWSRRMRRW